MASPYSVPHSRSTLGVKVLQPRLFSPGVGSRSLDATSTSSQQSSLSSQARPRKGSALGGMLVLDSSTTLKKLELSCPARRGLLRKRQATDKTPRREQGCGTSLPQHAQLSNSVRVTSTSSTPTDQAFLYRGVPPRLSAGTGWPTLG
ncbi:hypothetical protein J3F84DRAFT_347632 [Trichoderma pleuroticola]